VRGSRYTIVFATTLSVTVSILLSVVYMVLRERQDENRALEQQKSILSAAQIQTSSKKEIKSIYQARVKALVVNKQGDIIDNIDPSKISDDHKEYSILFAIVKDQDSKEILGYVYPIVGSGLWSKLYGYLAVDELGKNILGITFYKQGETPGLGAEIEKSWFINNFQGKSLFNENKLVGIKVAKGSAKLDPEYKYMSDQIVDGISGATITGDGVTSMLLKDPLKYEPFFKKKRGKT
jgi:Na+-transporting NADH:ubiquinone oxidoreductase subunit C